jgi:four helix bundle protein
MSGLNPVIAGDELLALAHAIAEAAYKTMEELPESEKWDLQPKIQRCATDAISTIAEGCGSLDPRDVTWRLGQSRGSLSELRSLFKLAHKVYFAKLNPDTMLQIDKAIKIIDTEVPVITANIKTWLAETYPVGSEVQA